MRNSTVIRFSLLGGLSFIAVFAVGLRLIAPRLEFQRLVDRDKTVRIREIQFYGQARQVVCRDPVLLHFFENGIRDSDRQGRVYYPNGIPEGVARKYVPYQMRVTMDSGTYDISCSVAKDELCMYFPFEEDLSGEGAPNRRMVFDCDVPKRIQLAWEYLLSDREDVLTDRITLDADDIVPVLRNK